MACGPFEGATRIQLLDAVAAGRLRTLEDTRGVPGFLHEAIVAGLATDPAARPASMADLLTQLRRDPARQRRRLMFAVGGVAAVGAAAWAGSLLTTEPEPCTGLSAPIDAVWAELQRASTRDALQATFTGQAANATMAAIDVYAQSWIDARVEACTATRIRAEQSEARLDQQMGCLDDRRRAFAALVSVFGDADFDAATDAVTAVAHLPRVAACSDPRYLAARVEPPAPEQQDAVAALRERIDRAQAEYEVGRVAPARDAMRDIHTEAEALGYEPLTSDAAFRLAAWQRGLGENDAETLELLLGAVVSAQRADAVQTAARAQLELATACATILHRPDEALRWASLAEGGIDRLGDAGNELRSRLFGLRANIARSEGDLDQAQTLLEQAYALDVQAYGADAIAVTGNALLLGELLVDRMQADRGHALIDDAIAIRSETLGESHPATVSALLVRAGAFQSQGRSDEAEALQRDALKRTRVSLGDDHPRTALRQEDLAEALASAGRFDEARELAAAALKTTETALGPAHWRVGESLGASSKIALMAGDFKAAGEFARRALPLLEAHFGPTHHKVTGMLDAMGGAAFFRGDLEEAAKYAERSLAIRREVFGPLHDDVATGTSNLGEVYEKAGDLGEAEARFRQALAVRQAVVGLDHPSVAHDRFELGRVLVTRGRPEEAIEHLEDAVRIYGIRPAPEREVAAVKQLLERARAAAH